MRLAPSQFDAVVIGGGIQGLTFAHEAGLRGLHILLLEATEFGSGSTAASFGIVHGGFRYWQDLDAVRLVRSRREQAWFLRSFPGLVRPLRCVMPFYAGDRAKPALFAVAAAADRAGSVCAGSKAPDLPPPVLLRRRELLELAPWLEQQNVRGAGCWHDVEIVDYPALVEELLGRAAAQGARCLKGMEVKRVLAEGSEITGVEALDQASGATLCFEAPVVVNCAGAALEKLARLGHSASPRFFQPLRAFNLHLAHGRQLGAAFAVGTGKRLFVRPCPGGSLAGTFYGTGDDMEGWLGALDAAAPGLDVRTGTVLRVLAGVVPAGPDGAEPAKRDVILDHGAVGGPRGLFSLSGVKLTTARWLSARAVARIWRGRAGTANKAVHHLASTRA